MTDRELIDGFLKGDNQHYKAIHEWIALVIRSRSWVPGISEDDLASDTIYKLLTNFRDRQFRFESSLKTYVQKITRFTIIDAVRRNRRTHHGGQDLVDTAPDPDSFLDAFQDDEELALYQRIVSLIGPECRSMWQLIFHNELPYAEIAKSLHISVGAVKTRVLRCKEKAIEIRKRIT